MKLMKDSDLKTKEEIMERINSIKRQIDTEEAKRQPASSLKFQQRHEKIVKLHERKRILLKRYHNKNEVNYENTKSTL